ncbi:MAG: (2Fe-2S)-binding protein [Candidatus Wallbacteria bacterium]|nr:(2Fe-2S)-binding protein [Candidatus Wallbacteria bacterium]
MPPRPPKIVLTDPFAGLPDETAEPAANVTFQPFGQTVPARIGKTLLDTARVEGVKLPHACGGHSRCGTCRVRVLQGAENLCEIDVVERRTLKQYAILLPGFRLGCRARVLGDCTVHVEMTAEQAAASWNEKGSSAWRPRGGWK